MTRKTQRAGRGTKAAPSMLIVWQPSRRQKKIAKNVKNMDGSIREKEAKEIHICRTLFHLTHALLPALDTPLWAALFG